MNFLTKNLINIQIVPSNYRTKLFTIYTLLHVDFEEVQTSGTHQDFRGGVGGGLVIFGMFSYAENEQKRRTV